jgi:hypothetical protein
LAGALVIVVPVLWFGPWLPFLDAINFIALDSYPAHLSNGPHQYYVFEFTYILPFILSRLCVDFGIGVAAQVSLFYFLQALIFFGATWQILERVVRDPWIRSISIVAGSLAFWDAMFIWGGPLAFSLSAASLALAGLLSIREAGDPERPSTGVVALLTLLAIISHPFAVFFALPLFAVRIVLLPTTRWRSVVIAALVLVYGVIIQRDSVDAPAGSLLPQLFGLHPIGTLTRISELFTWNRGIVDYLLGISPAALSAYFIVLGAVHLLGFLASPFVAALAKDAPALRLLALLDTVVAAMFFLALPDNAVISWWPQRILSYYNWVTFSAGIACPAYLILRYMPKKAGGETTSSSLGRRSLAWILPALLIPGLIAAEVPVLRLGPVVPREWRSVRSTILDTGLKNIILYPEYVDVAPFYRRCVAFLLFSDRSLIQRDIQVFTEWSAQPRHPSRTVDTGKPHYRLRLSVAANGNLTAQVLPDR